MPSVIWFRRDLRLSDHPAVVAAAAAEAVVPLFVLDPALLRPAGAPRVAFLFRALRALADGLSGQLVVLPGDPVDVVPRVAAEVGADAVHISTDFGPYGASRDRAVERALTAAGRTLVRTGSPYAVSQPGPSAAPATRSSTRGCGSSPPKRGCTTGSGWWSPPSS